MTYKINLDVSFGVVQLIYTDDVENSLINRVVLSPRTNGCQLLLTDTHLAQYLALRLALQATQFSNQAARYTLSIFVPDVESLVKIFAKIQLLKPDFTQDANAWYQGLNEFNLLIQSTKTKENIFEKLGNFSEPCEINEHQVTTQVCYAKKNQNDLIQKVQFQRDDISSIIYLALSVKNIIAGQQLIQKIQAYFKQKPLALGTYTPWGEENKTVECHYSAHPKEDCLQMIFKFNVLNQGWEDDFILFLLTLNLNVYGILQEIKNALMAYQDPVQHPILTTESLTFIAAQLKNQLPQSREFDLVL